MFQKFTPQAFAPEIKSQSSVITKNSDETGEPENTAIKPNEIQKEERTMKNLLEMKSLTATTVSSDLQNVPDVLKICPSSLNKIDKPVPKPVEKDLEKSKENIRETSETDKKENIVKPFTKAVVKPSVFAPTIPSVSSPSGVPGEQKHLYYLSMIYCY